MISRFLLCFVVLVVLPFTAHAAQSPTPGSRDERVRSVRYETNNVVRVYGTYGISTMVVFAEDEEFQTIAVGDSNSWEVVPAGAKNILFVKPIARNARTNMNVVTNKRIYHFDLLDYGPEDNRKVFSIRFVYPDQNLNKQLREEAELRVKYPNISKVDKDNINIDYSFTGDKNLKPVKIFDDGVKTFLQFKGNRVPAIFRVNSDYSETLVNFRKEGEYIVVDGEHTQLTLREGDQWVCLFNLRKPDFGAPREDITGPAEIPVPKFRRGSGNKRQ